MSAASELDTNLYLVASLFDDGIRESNVRIVRAESEFAIAEHILACPHQWQCFLEQSRPEDWQHPEQDLGTLWDCVQNSELTPEKLLTLIGMTRVQGRTAAQLAILPVRVDSLATLNTDPWW